MMQANPPAIVDTQLPFVGTRNGWFPNSAQDKSLHFQTGIVGGAVMYFIYKDFLKLKNPFLWTVLTGVCVGMAKELYDRRHHGSPEYADALNTGMGYAVGAGFSVSFSFGVPRR